MPKSRLKADHKKRLQRRHERKKFFYNQYKKNYELALSEHHRKLEEQMELDKILEESTEEE